MNINWILKLNNKRKGEERNMIPEFTSNDPLGFWREAPSDISLARQNNREFEVNKGFPQNV